MKILQIVADGNPGGGTTVVLGLLEECLRAGMDTHFLTQTGSYAAQRGRDLGATVHEADFFSSHLNKAAEERIHEVAGAVLPQVAHMHGSRAAYFGRRGLGTPTAYTIHGYHFLRKPHLRRLLGLIAETRASRTIAVMVFVCKYDQDVCNRYHLAPRTTQQMVIYNGIRLEDLGQDARPEAGLIVFLGRLLEQKDPLLAVHVAAQLAPEGYRLEMVGGGELERQVKGEIRRLGLESSVSVTGVLKREDALDRLRRAEVLLMTSKWEGLPVAAQEAMALGVPVVAPRTSGIPELIDHGVTGLLVDSRDPADFAAAVRRARDERDGLVKAAERRIQDQFLWDNCAFEHLKLYARLSDRA